MRSDVIELPEAMEAAELVAGETEAAEYCTYTGSNILEWHTSRMYDLVFMGNIIHHFSRDEIRTLLEKVFARIVCGGMLAAWDLSADPGGEDPTAACFSLFFYITSASRCYSPQEIEALIADTGFLYFEILRPPGGSTHALYLARKPAS